MSRVIVFDVNETLLDLAALDAPFQRIFGQAGVRREWFGQFLQSALVATVTNTYTPFGDIAMSALEMVANRHGHTLNDENRHTVKQTMSELPAHPEVAQSLELLQSAGLRLATLTNSTERVAETQLAHAGLTGFFELRLSADTVRRLKPAPEPYRMAAERLGVPIDQIRLVAAHAWDIAGAQRTGAATAFVARPGQVLDPLVPRPDIVGKDLREVAERIIEVEG